MRRDPRALLADVIEACDAIASAILGLDLAAYPRSRLVRSAVEREFIIIGEAVASLSRVAPATCAAISRARRVVDSRNLLTHGYAAVDDAIVLAIAQRDVPVLREEYAELLAALG